MGFDWKEYLYLAKELKQRAGNTFNQEAALRSAVSRAYYAAFCYLRNYACDKLGFIKKRSSRDHIDLVKHLREKNHGDIASILEELRNWRKDCDYEDVIKGDLQTKAGSAIKRVEEIFASYLK